MTAARWVSVAVVERRPGRWTLRDLGLAVVLLAVMVIEVFPNPDMTPRLPLLLLSIPLTLPLAWRTTQPVPVALAVTAANLGLAAVSTGTFAPQLSALPVVVAVFGAASRARGRTAVVTGGAVLVLVLAAWYLSPEGHVDDFWPWLLWAGCWSTGTFVRRRADAEATQAARAAILEVEARTAAAEGTARERDRIARELHDVVAHGVSVMVVQAGAERLRLGPDAGRTGEVLAAIEEAGRTALGELRAMLGVLRAGDPEGSAPLPGLSDVTSLVSRVADSGLPITLTMDPRIRAADTIPVAVGLAAYRVVQEAVTNVVRHAPGAETRVVLERLDDRLEVTVTNEPSTHAPTGGAPGHGLVGMRERARAVDGCLSAGPRADGGFEVRAVLPLGRGATR